MTEIDNQLRIIINNTRIELAQEAAADEILATEYPDDYEPDSERQARLQQTLTAAVHVQKIVSLKGTDEHCNENQQ